MLQITVSLILLCTVPCNITDPVYIRVEMITELIVQSIFFGVNRQ